jgi:hypothetical protein
VFGWRVGICARHAFVERGLRALLTNYGFTVSVLVAVVITAIFAFVFDAPPPLVEAMLALGIFTALMEHFLQSDDGQRR